ncbi:MAG: segregation/condensation protein A [Candidatus ainarchaeum sp.]|nr:segregation/condensation protein A [Candidatus ainarchaeum sp.]
MIEEEKITDYGDDTYLFKLDNFEGPLDLLLEIIKKNKLDIEDVKLSDITGQYLAYMKNLEAIDMEKASEFILMASTLIDIKSRSLMPRLEEQTDEPDDEALILSRLKEYQIFKQTAETLKVFENVDHFYREPDEKVGNPRFVLKDMVMDKLLDAFVGILTKVDKKIIMEEPKKIVKDRFTVADKIINTKALLKQKKQLEFEELFEDGQTRSELINIFLAILELLKMQFAKIRQTEIFGRIELYLNENIGAN